MAVERQMNRDVYCPGIEEANPSWKCLPTRKMASGGARRGMGLKFKCLEKLNEWMQQKVFGS